VLAGPNIASEVVAGYAAAATIAMPDQNSAHKLAELFRTERFRIYSTTDPTSISRPSLMQDRQYRVAVAWQNSGYNQPPHPSFASP